MTPLKKQVLKTKICCACKKEKDIRCFYACQKIADGYENRCKICKKERIKCNSNKKLLKSPGRPKERELPELWNVRKGDWIETYKFLESIGYNLNENIHKQFCEKFGLLPRKRMKEKSIQYTPKDLGLV